MATTPYTNGWRPLGEPQPTVGEARDASSLLDIFAETVARHPENVAIDAPDAVLTYAQLSHAADRVADELRGAGVGAGERVGVRLTSGRSSLYLAILGVLRSGAAYVPVDAEDPPARALGIYERADVCGVIEDDLRFTPMRSSSSVERDLNGGDDAWVIFTSGSTGEPKGVAVSHRSAVAFIEAEARLWTVSSEDRVLAASTATSLGSPARRGRSAMPA